MSLAEMASQLNIDKENNNKIDVDTSNSIENMRQFLKEQIDKIFVDQKLTKQQYATLYSKVYDFCVKGKEVGVWTKNKEFYNPNTDGTAQLCEHIDQFLNDHLKKISKSTPETDEECLDYYYHEWQKFQLSSKTLNNVCKYLNEQQHKRNANAKSIKLIALHIWSDHLLKSLNEKVSKAALRMLDRNREGELINSSAIKVIVESYLELGSVEITDQFQDELTVYKAFEQRILDGTLEYYSKVSETAMQKFYIDEKSFVAYLKHVQSSLLDEMKRATLLHSTTETALMRVCYDSLISKHEDVFCAEFQIFLIADKKDEMELICSLAVHSETVIKRLNKIFEEYVLQQGLDEIEKCANETIKDPKKYIDTIIAVYEKFRHIVDHQFKNEFGFSAALDKACASFINDNRLTKKSDNRNKSAEFLAAYCHLLLKKSNKNMEEADLDRTLNQMMIVFRFIEDKDVFEGFYKKRLAERLINELSASDAEALMISKLKQALGYDYTTKLQRMYQDIEVSKDLNEKFREKRFSNDDSLDFRIKVLSNGSWPLKQYPKFNLPAELTKPIDRFTAFYSTQHNSRKLMWLHRISKAEVVMKGLRSIYFIKMNTLQLTILLQFNERPTFSVQQLQENTDIEVNYLKQMLETSLIKSKILKQSDPSKLTETSTIEFNTDFKEPKMRFDITAKLDSERKAEQNETHQRIDDDRKFAIEAAIVRIMKMRKELNHQNLVGEVLTQLSKQFKPKVPAVKKCIDSLIEKEYLARKEGQKDIYQYLA